MEKLDENVEFVSIDQGFADALAFEQQILENAVKLRELISAYAANSTEEEIIKSEVKIGNKTIEVNFNRRQLWEQLAYLQQQLANKASKQSDSSIEDLGFELGAVTMAASLSYIIWFLRGSAMMATMVTQVPAWKMVDPLVILDSLDKNYVAGSEDSDGLSSFFDQPTKP